jgi:hypothetical protein
VTRFSQRKIRGDVLENFAVILSSIDATLVFSFPESGKIVCKGSLNGFMIVSYFTEKRVSSSFHYRLSYQFEYERLNEYGDE